MNFETDFLLTWCKPEEIDFSTISYFDMKHYIAHNVFIYINSLHVIAMKKNKINLIQNHENDR